MRLYFMYSRENQAVVEASFMPTLQILLDAPTSSPLSEVDVNNVIVLLIQLTNHRLLRAGESSSKTSDMCESANELTPHDSLALKICNELIAHSNVESVPYLSKALTLLDINKDNEMLAKDLFSLVSSLKEVCDDIFFLQYINALIVQDNSHYSFSV